MKIAEKQRNIIVGSMARLSLMGVGTVSSRRPDGTLRDIDVINLDNSCDYQKVDGVRIDPGMTRIFRPFNSESWGLFLPGNEQPEIQIDSSDCQLSPVVIPWSDPEDPITIETLTAAIQAELIDIAGRYHKNPQHAREFKNFAASQAPPISKDTKKAFRYYRKARRPSTYKRLRRIALNYLPSNVSEAISPIVRKVRGTPLD